MPDPNAVVMEGVRIVFRNFTGRPGPYNDAGQRSFHVVISDELGNVMAEDGWNVKWFKPDEDAESDEPTEAHLEVKVKYSEKARPPRAVLVTSRGRKNLDEHEIEDLDWVNIKNVDLIVRPYPWSMNGKSGITAYLQSIYVTAEEDVLEQKYAELDEQ